jgi:hypothetical protein
MHFKEGFMRRLSAAKALFFGAVLFCGLFCSIYAEGLNNNEVEFTGTISTLVLNGEGVGTVFIHVENVDLRVIVNSNAELSDQAGDSIEMSGLAAGDVVKVKGKFSASGILASEIQLQAKTNDDFQLRGRITNVQSSGANTLVSLLGITIVVNSDTKITTDEGASAPVTDLKNGMLVQVAGTISGSTWTATTIKILSEQKKKNQVRFAGTVQAVTSTMIQVEVDGVSGGLTTVLLNSNTRIVGDLAKGVLVEVKGTLNSDLSVTATEVRVLPALEIKPDERKLKIGETGSFTVKLRETASADVNVALSLSDASVLALSTASITILKGNKTADFSANGLKVGSSVITAAALGQKATAKVTVGEVSENENEQPAGDVRVAFAPEKIKMSLNDTREVVLLIKPPQKSAVTVQFSVKPELVTVLASRDFSNGAAALKVTIQSGSKEGTASVVATLPSALGGGKAELLVEVTAKKEGNEEENPEIDFRPDEVGLGVGETRGVKLLSSTSFDKDVPIIISSGGTIVQAPSSVVLSAGNKSVSVSVLGKAEGKVTLIAALPSSLGGDTAKLEVEVRNKK